MQNQPIVEKNKFVNDIENIDAFIEQNKDRYIVAVQGLGFVGAAMSFVVANAPNYEYAVIGVDLPENYKVINSLNSGILHINSSDPKIEDYFYIAKKKNTFYATYDKYAYSKADIIIVDINLDVDKKQNQNNELFEYDVDLQNFKLAIRDIAQNCKEDVLTIVESTVPPGTCENIVKPIFEEEFNSRGIQKLYKIGHSYERVMPGPEYIDSIKNFYRVYSGINEESANATEKFLRKIISTNEYPLTRLSNTTASETSKVLENSYRAMNIAFIQEWTEFAEKSGVNLYEIIDAIRMRPTHKNLMYPGLGVGGYCLTKDSLLASWASQKWFNSNKLQQSEEAIKINDKMPLHTFKVVKNFFENNLEGTKILILGISYLKNVGDTRYTPVGLLYDNLIKETANIKLHDPFVDYWFEKDLKIDESDDLFKHEYDAIIFATPHDYYLDNNILQNILMNSNKTTIFDTYGAIPISLMNKFKNKHKFKVIGRGDV